MKKYSFLNLGLMTLTVFLFSACGGSKAILKADETVSPAPTITVTPFDSDGDGVTNQEETEIFGTDPLDAEDVVTLTEEEQVKLEQLQELDTTEKLIIVQSPSDPQNEDFIDFGYFRAIKREVNEKGPNSYTWIGDLDGIDGNVILVLQDGRIIGTVEVFKQGSVDIFSVQTLGTSENLAVIKVDQNQFPPEHPAEFDEAMSEYESDSLDNVADETCEDTMHEISVLVAYTQAAAKAHSNIEDLIKLAIEEANQGYQKSNISIRLTMAHTVSVDYTESGTFDTDLDRFANKHDGYMDGIHDLRDKYGADVSVLLIDNDEYCGLADTILAHEDSSFAVVYWKCATGYYSFAHEIGHLQGARHNPEKDSKKTPFAYGHGAYHEKEGYRTIMSYACPSASGCTRINYWSTPDIDYSKIAIGDTDTRNNARVLRETACRIADFRATPPSLPTPPPPLPTEEVQVAAVLHLITSLLLE